MEVCGLVNRMLDSRSKGLGFDSHCWSCVEVSGEIFIPYCLCLASSGEYLVDGNCIWVSQATCMTCTLYSPRGDEMKLLKLCVSGKIVVGWIWYRFQTLCYVSLPLASWSSALTLKVLNFWKFTSYCSLKPLWSGMGEVVPACTSPTLHPPSPPTVHQLSWLAL